MAFYLILFAGVSVFSFLFSKLKFRFKDEILILLVFSFLCILSCIRYDVGFDYSYGGYTGLWNRVLETPIAEIKSVDDEIGFTLITYFLSLFGKNYQIFYTGTSIIIALLAALFVYLHCKDKFWAVFLIYGLGIYYGSMNLIRQYMAMLIFAFAVPMIKKKKLIPFVILVLLSASIHKSALLMLPFYFVLQIEITGKVLAVYLLLTGAVFLTSDMILDYVTKLWYGGYVGTIYLEYGNDWYYLIAPVLLFVLIFAFKERICRGDKRNYVYVNCAFFNFFFWFISWKHLLVDRFSVYFEPAVIICVCILMRNLYNDSIECEDEEKISVRKKIIIASAVVLSAGIISNLVCLKDDGHGILPYDSIIGNPEFKMYTESLKMQEDGAVILAPEIL